MPERARKPALNRATVVDLDLWGGWCTVRFRAEGETVDMRGHWFSDCFTDLIHAVADMLEGRRTACVRFSRESGGGGFVDLARDGDDGICIAVHETWHGADVGTRAEMRSPARGKLLLDARVPTTHFVRDYLRALQRIRTLSVDASGLSRHWPHTFPQSAYEALERIATSRFGYSTAQSYEITGEDPRPWPTREPGTFGPSVE